MTPATNDYQAVSPGSSAGGASVGADADEDYSVATLRQQLRDFLDLKQAELDEQRTARHYYHDDQLTSDEKKILKDRGQPAVIRNKINRKINGVVGLLARVRQDPKAYPRTPKHEDGAEIATATVRYIMDVNRWQGLRTEAARNGAINGIFGVEQSLIKGDKGDPDVGLARVDNDTFFYDPRSFGYGFEDARFMGVAKWVDIDVAKEMFPDKADDLTRLIETGASLAGVQQRDRELKWTDTTRKRLFLVEHWHILKGEWQFCFYCGDTKLAFGKSPFFDEKGKTTSRYIMGSVNVDHDGDRYGYVRTLKSLQDEVNARASKGLHLLNTRRVKMEVGAVKDVDTLRREMNRPDGVIEINPNKYLEFDDEIRLADLKGQLEFMAEVKTEIENFGPNPALIGEGIDNKSGRAIALLQQAGLAELGPSFDVFRDWNIRVYRAAWTAAQRNWKAERFIRVTDDEGLAQFIQLNGLSMDENGTPRMVNAIGALDVDIVLDEGPDTINMMQDNNDTLTALAQSGQPIPPQVLIELSPIQSSVKKKVLDILEQASQPSDIDVATTKAGLQKTDSETAKNAAQAHKTMAEIPGVSSKSKRDEAGALRDVVGAATELHQTMHPPPPKDGARPSDGGMGQFS